MWLEAGVLESGEWTRRRRARRRGRASARCSPTSSCTTCSTSGFINGDGARRAGSVIVVRYADDFVMGFENEADARADGADLKDRLKQFGLALHEDKTRLIEFGRLPRATSAPGQGCLARYVRLPGLHSLLRVDEGRAVHREAQDAEQAHHPQVERASPRRVAAHARITGRPAPLVRQRAAWSLRVLRHASQLAGPGRLPAGNCEGSGSSIYVGAANARAALVGTGSTR